MSTRFNTLRHGEPDKAVALLKDGLFEHVPSDAQELRAALINALSRIAELERQVAALQAARADVR